MLYEFHFLRNYPATNLNRDDTGAPKTCVFGGTTRARISSQCLKRSWRSSELFRNEIGTDNLGIRTRKLPELVAEELINRGVAKEYVDEIVSKLTGIANKEGKENDKGSYTAQVIFFAKSDVNAVADAVQKKLAECADVKEVKKIKAKELQTMVEGPKERSITLDIALFGRMVTSDAFRDVEASIQVAHAVSTHGVIMESDYFTAMDDLLESGDSMESNGSGMIGDVDYNSACYYSYVSLDSDALLKNLEYTENAEEIVRKAIPALIRAMALTNPSAKQNSFAGHVLPSAILVECKEKKIPVSYVNAYAEPVRARNVVKESTERLVKECNLLADAYGIEVSKRLWFCLDKEMPAPENAIRCANFNEMLDKVESTLK